jgi:hypothetical protein
METCRSDNPNSLCNNNQVNLSYTTCISEPSEEPIDKRQPITPEYLSPAIRKTYLV